MMAQQLHPREASVFSRFRRSFESRAGFTLIELIVVMAITGIIAAALIVFFGPATDAYFQSRRRAGLSDAADTALRRMARDIRMAVPNSIRSPNNQCFELLPTSTGGRYRMVPDTVIDSSANCVPAADCSAPLDTSQPSTGFDVLSPLSTVPAAGDLVVVGNHNANDVYAGGTRATLTGTTSPNVNFGPYRFSFSSTQFPIGYDGGRFTVVPANGGLPAVVYICSNASGVDANGSGTGTLYRLNRALTAAYPTACPSTSGASVVTTHVRSCNFVYSSSTGSTQQNGFVSLQIELAEENEIVSLSFGAHVDNLP